MNLQCWSRHKGDMEVWGYWSRGMEYGYWDMMCDRVPVYCRAVRDLSAVVSWCARSEGLHGS